MTSHKKLRMIVLSATGSGRKRTIPAINDSALVSVVAIHGRDSTKLEAIAKQYGIANSYTDLDEMLSKEEFDFAFVASPPFLHKEHILKLCNANKPILCEKPLCISPMDAAAICEAVKAANTPFRLAHHVRHQKAIEDIKIAVTSGEIGDVRLAFLQWSFNLNREAPNAAWKLDPKIGGDHSFFDAGVHGIDLALALFGPPRAVIANGLSTFPGDTLDSSVAIFEYKSFNVVLAASMSQAPVGNDLRIYGTDGSIVAPGALNETAILRVELQAKQRSNVREYKADNLYKSEVEDFARMIISSNPDIDPGTTLAQAVLAVQLLSKLSDSMSSGRRLETER